MATTTVSRASVRRWGAGTAAIVRLLVAVEAPLTGVAIAHAVGVTQPRASQVLKQLAALDAVRGTEDGYMGRRTRLLDLYLRRARPLLVEPEGHWYITRSMAEQAHQIIELAHATKVSVTFSADLAPDFVAPWRHPTLTVVYTSHRLALHPIGFVPAEGRSDASVLVRWTRDHSLFAPTASWPTQVDGLPLADPVQQWSDLLELGGDDRQEAASRLRRAILDRTIARAM